MYFVNGGFCSVRYFSLLSTKLNNYATREGRMIQKLMKGSLKKKKNWYQAEKRDSFMPVPKQGSFHQGNTFSKRIAVLNKLFMKNITDLMATGEVAGEILGRGISVSRVQVTPDYNIVNVYWLAKGTDEDATIEKLLSDAAHALRHELTQLHVLGGVVPRIVFVKDKQSAIIAEVDYLLSKADFGDDYEPPEPASYFKSEFTSSGPPLPQDQRCDEDDEEPLPPMRMDVMGLNHSEIMNRISKSVKKSEAPHRRNQTIPVQELPVRIEEKQFPLDDTKCQNVDIVKFIQKQKILKEKKRRQEKKIQQDKESLYLHPAIDFPFEDSYEKEEDFIEEIEDLHRM